MCIVQNGLNGQPIMFMFILFSSYGLHVCYHKLMTFSISSARDSSIFVSVCMHLLHFHFICRVSLSIGTKILIELAMIYIMIILLDYMPFDFLYILCQ